MNFKLIENNIETKYKYFGAFNYSSDGIGFDLPFPENNSKNEWFEFLSIKVEYEAAATIGTLFFYVTNSTLPEFHEVRDIVTSTAFTSFIYKWFNADGSIFKEPSFFDGYFGQFSSNGNMGYPDNEVSKSREFTWMDKSTIIKFNEPFYFEDLRNKIFIDINKEIEFFSELESIIQLFEE